MARIAPLRRNSPYPPSGPDMIPWIPTLIVRLRLRAGAAKVRPERRPKPSAAARTAPASSNCRRLISVGRDAARLLLRGVCFDIIGLLLQLGSVQHIPTI